MSCPSHCRIDLRHIHERDNEWPHVSMVAHKGCVELHIDDGFQSAWHTLTPETAICLAMEILATADEAAVQPRTNVFRANR